MPTSYEHCGDTVFSIEQALPVPLKEAQVCCVLDIQTGVTWPPVPSSPEGS